VSQGEKKSPRSYLASDDREGISFLTFTQGQKQMFKDILAGWKKDSF